MANGKLVNYVKVQSPKHAIHSQATTTSEIRITMRLCDVLRGDECGIAMKQNESRVAIVTVMNYYNNRHHRLSAISGVRFNDNSNSDVG